MAIKKHVYFFGGGKAEGKGSDMARMKVLLGGKGAGLAEMTNIGLPVPAGFTITTEVCDYYYKHGKKYPRGFAAEVSKHLKRLEKLVGKKLGDPEDPLLVSVRSGAAMSMPGMMETILNLGLNDVSVEGLAKKTSNRRFALDAYRRFIFMYGSTAKGIDRLVFDREFGKIKDTLTRKRLGTKKAVILDTEVNEEELAALIPCLKKVYRDHTGEDFPQDPTAQLWGSIDAVIGSWMAEKAVTYRRVEKITGLLGTAVNVVQMVFGNKGEDSGTGVCFTRDPNSGEDVFYGDLLMNAQGEDVVAGIRTPLHLLDLKKIMPDVYRQLEDVRKKLEGHYKDMQDIEFTIEEGKLYILQTRTGKRSPAAAFKIAVDMVKEKLATREEAVLRIRDKDIEGLFYPVIDPSIAPDVLRKNLFARGIDAVPGAATGAVVFTAKDAEDWAAQGEDVILVRQETSPEDVGGMHAARGILTATGGKTSHAAVVARGWGKCCVVGCEDLQIDSNEKTVTVGEKTIREGDFITLNGSTGEVFVGKMDLKEPELPGAYDTLMKWTDKMRTLKVRTNVDTPYDAENAIKLGAEGIGLCRTEHMFFDTEERRLAIQRMIIADDVEERKEALSILLPIQRTDFEEILTAMKGKPVTIRLLDPPLHEFVPHIESEQRKLAKRLGIPFNHVKRSIERLHETNPMLGLRGSRLCIVYPEILDMQVRAIIEAACDCKKKKIKVLPEIMLPLIIDAKEFKILADRTRAVASVVMAEQKVKVTYLVGTMIEVPRAALLADKVAAEAEFFSFGTNDLTQMTLGMSRDDAGRYLPDYVDEKKGGILKDDPFQSLDQEGVGLLIKMGIEKGRKSRPGLKIGICGEHGGDPASVEFCHLNGFDYVSCSPFRVPIARLSAAQAAFRHPGKKKSTPRRPKK
ncbi:MAG: pyruvate, phosphate dikinase [Thermodesulfobacteriota bacterium]|nr:MAG: pyruvate, phosphate dikinase [Thermodesulfobacteriota bacterium]